jgi:hypothetical protein
MVGALNQQLMEQQQAAAVQQVLQRMAPPSGSSAEGKKVPLSPPVPLTPQALQQMMSQQQQIGKRQQLKSKKAPTKVQSQSQSKPPLGPTSAKDARSTSGRDVAPPSSTSRGKGLLPPIMLPTVSGGGKLRGKVGARHGPSGSGNSGGGGAKEQARERRRGISPSGSKVLELFESFALEPPREVSLRVLWDRIVDDDVGGRILQANRRLLGSELRRHRVKHAPGALRTLDPILRRQVLGREQVQGALQSALKLQAGKHSVAFRRAAPAPVPVPVSSAAAPTAAVVSASLEEKEDMSDRDTDAGSSGEGGSSSSSSSSSVDHSISSNSEVIESTVPEFPATQQQQEHTKERGEEEKEDAEESGVVLSQWALDSALSAALQLPSPRMGRLAASRTPEQLAALAADKYERALLANVISPQDIGVTYDMIGTLYVCICVYMCVYM